MNSRVVKKARSISERTYFSSVFNLGRRRAQFFGIFLNDAGEAGQFLNAGARQPLGHSDLIAQHPYTDGAAHPDWFLGKVDALAVRWEQVFNTPHLRGVLCEYKLTTPLRPEMLEIALTKTDVAFTIGSDRAPHNGRKITRRKYFASR